LRVFVPEENDQNGAKEVKQEVLKFVGWFYVQQFILEFSQ
jgi:hypothetical protein